MFFTPEIAGHIKSTAVMSETKFVSKLTSDFSNVFFFATLERTNCENVQNFSKATISMNITKSDTFNKRRFSLYLILNFIQCYVLKSLNKFKNGTVQGILQCVIRKKLL